MPPPYVRHLFVCTNRRPDGSPKGCCASKGSEDVRVAFKHELDKQGVKGVRANASGCLDACERGIAAVVYPEGVWYGEIKTEDVEELVREHFVNGRPVERLKLKPIPKRDK